MATNRKSTLTKVGTAVKKAARTVSAKANKYVVKPVGKALGVKGKKTAAKSSGKKTTGTAKAGSAKKTAGKSAKKTTAGSAKKGTAKSGARGK